MPVDGHLLRRIGLALLVLAGPAPLTAADRDHPTIVELFTAQGCAACPPAQQAVNALASRADVLPLSFSVTYWDALGWRDRFAQPAFTERQRAYARLSRRAVATPQVVLNGRFAVVGNDAVALGQAIVAADRGVRGPAIAMQAGRIAVGADRVTGRAATVWLVQYDPRTISVAVKAGENAGRTLPHRNVVRMLTPVGRWSGTATSYRLPSARSPWKRAVLVQSADGGAIIAAAALDR